MHRSIFRVGRCVRSSPLSERFLKSTSSQASTFSPLASAFDNAIQINLEGKDVDNVGLFNIPELKTSEGFHTLQEDLVTRVECLVQQAISAPPSANVVTIFDTVSNELCKVADMAEFIRQSHTDARYAKAAELTSFKICGLVEKLNTHYDFYKALKNAVKYGEDIDSVTMAVADLFLFDFEQSGIHLPPSKQKLAMDLHEAILITGSQFTQNASLPREYPLHKWPNDVGIVHAITNKSTIVVDSACSESGNPQLREQGLKAYMSPCKKQLELLENLLYCRDLLSSTLGFPSYSHRSLRGTMGSDPDNVVSFLDRTLCMLEMPLQQDLDVIRKYRKDFYSVHEDNIAAWDIGYYTSLISSQAFSLSWKHISEYFSVGACMEGLNIIFSSLYGVSLKVVSSAPGEVWATDVQKVEVRHEDEGVLGIIYCDLYQRRGKLPQDCHFTIRGGKLLESGNYQSPIVCLMCNFPAPQHDKPSLLTQSMVENLFHEMGHAMHSMLGRARYQHVTGTRCTTDFAEVPSILMEYFCRDPRIMKLYAKHYETGEPLSEDVIRTISSSSNLFSAVDLQVQAFRSIVDQKFHGRHQLGKSITDTLNDLHKVYKPLTLAAGTSWHLRFSHLHSYGAKYYAYVWSKAVASGIWHNCFAKDPLSRVAGERYRDKMLKHGGGKHPQVMVDDMLSKQVSVDDLVAALQYDLTM